MTSELDIRAVARAAEFAIAPADAARFVDTVAEIWADGESRPEWCFLGSVDGQAVARLGFLQTDSVTDPAWLGALPARELSLFALAAWATDPAATLESMIRRTAAAVAPGLDLQIRTNPAVHADYPLRRELAGRLGLPLFQEKQGVRWAGGEVRVPGRVAFRTITDAGTPLFRTVLAGAGAGTLDRNDRWYRDRTGPEHWADQMLVYCEPGDEPSWLIGEVDGRPVGYVAVSAFDDAGTATVSHLGVLPASRGNGYAHDLLAAGTAAAVARGYTAILSDVDVLNGPMLAAMERAGHHASGTDWHVWDYRGPIDS